MTTAPAPATTKTAQVVYWRCPACPRGIAFDRDEFATLSMIRVFEAVGMPRFSDAEIIDIALTGMPALIEVCEQAVEAHEADHLASAA